eukprot:CAMPEP_0176219476 /NCGR_PEP_ID=MMETSP0121_2-20121125/18727_1 /TAXON_ID=160619 /ORGANISM="Kryptoperidinium foliaceum, Strain CCMP 1326" /LENGTH=226 /DNA_ID=CAMNT_0017558637 /DNA_START=8 /DNA_END=688 /DNA_ORIENTATION=+
MGFGGGSSGKGKKGKKGFGGGKGKSGGGKGGFTPMGPVTQMPPTYPPELMKHLPPPKYPPGKEDCDLVTHNRLLLRFWKCSDYYVHAPASVSQTIVGSGSRESREAAELDRQMWKVVHGGGLGPAFFPAELLLRGPLRVRGRATQQSVVELLKKLEAREGARGRKGQEDAGADDGAKGEASLGDEADDVADEDFGDDDDLGRYGDFEDGMGDDFEDPGAGDGDAEL